MELCIDGDVKRSPRAEGEFQREVERVGGFAVDPDEALLSTAAFNFLSDCRVLMVAATA